MTSSYKQHLARYFIFGLIMSILVATSVRAQEAPASQGESDISGKIKQEIEALMSSLGSRYCDRSQSFASFLKWHSAKLPEESVVVPVDVPSIRRLICLRGMESRLNNPYIDNFFRSNLACVVDTVKSSQIQKALWLQQLPWYHQALYMHLWKSPPSNEELLQSYSPFVRFDDPLVMRRLGGLNLPPSVDPISWGKDMSRDESTYGAALELILFAPYGTALELQNQFPEDPIATETIEGYWFSNVSFYVFQYAGKKDDPNRQVVSRVFSTIVNDDRRSPMVRGIAMELFSKICNSDSDCVTVLSPYFHSKNIFLRVESLRSTAIFLLNQKIGTTATSLLLKSCLKEAAKFDGEPWVADMVHEFLKKIDANHDSPNLGPRD